MTRDQHDKDQRERGEDFASRWSRLKRREKTVPAEPVAPVETGAAPAPMDAQDERPDEEILTELGLPDPETLRPGDDYAGFMAAAVPARIRNRALRRLWGSNPVLANLDGLVDYAEDFTDAATVPEVFRTAYKVGRGWLEDEGEADQAAVPDRAEVGEPAEDAPAEEALASAEEGLAPGEPATVEGGGKPGGEEASGAEVGTAPTAPRSTAEGRPGDEVPVEERRAGRLRARMHFRFSDK